MLRHLTEIAMTKLTINYCLVQIRCSRKSSFQNHALMSLLHQRQLSVAIREVHTKKDPILVYPIAIV